VERRAVPHRGRDWGNVGIIAIRSSLDRYRGGSSKRTDGKVYPRPAFFLGHVRPRVRPGTDRGEARARRMGPIRTSWVLVNWGGDAGARHLKNAWVDTLSQEVSPTGKGRPSDGTGPSTSPHSAWMWCRAARVTLGTSWTAISTPPRLEIGPGGHAREDRLLDRRQEQRSGPKHSVRIGASANYNLCDGC